MLYSMHEVSKLKRICRISVVWMLHSSQYLVGGGEEFAKYDSTMNIAEIQCRQH